MEMNARQQFDEQGTLMFNEVELHEHSEEISNIIMSLKMKAVL